MTKESMSRILWITALWFLAVLLHPGHGGAMGWWRTPPSGDLVRVTDFGSNPGNLRMYKYVPADLPDSPPLVVVLHGCTQSAEDYSDLSGWNALAERFGFCVVYPEQQRMNNGFLCFNWFDPDETERNRGEALSIKEMVDRMLTDHSIDSGRVFVTGLSAGGYMTSAMLAVYPDVFAGGAVMAGGPFRCSTNAIDASVLCMKGRVDHSPVLWGDLVRQSFEHQGPYPILSVFHGDEDPTVDDRNMTELVEQWTNVHGADAVSDTDESLRGHDHKTYFGPGGTPVVETYHIRGMGHAVPVDPGPGEDQGGTVGTHAEDRDIYSSYYAARFWRLIPAP